MIEYVGLIFSEVYKILFLLVPVLISVAMIVWLDRRVWAFVQKRRGPNVVGPFGLFRVFAASLDKVTSSSWIRLRVLTKRHLGPYGPRCRLTHAIDRSTIHCLASSMRPCADPAKDIIFWKKKQE